MSTKRWKTSRWCDVASTCSALYTFCDADVESSSVFVCSFVRLSYLFLSTSKSTVDEGVELDAAVGATGCVGAFCNKSNGIFHSKNQPRHGTNRHIKNYLTERDKTKEKINRHRCMDQKERLLRVS
jgi:hypothetical protein